MFAERAVLWVGLLWFVNLSNFMDGLDWMVVVGLGPALAFVGGLALLGGLTPAPGLIALGLLGGLLGFAPFNRPVARLFLGDVGSLAIGLGLGFGLIHLAGRHGLVAAALPALYFMADATFTLLRRAWAGEPVMSAHRSHIYQRATTVGWSVPQVIARISGLNLALLLLAGVAVAFSQPWAQAGAALAGAGLVAWLMRQLSRPPPGMVLR
jgi:UDP-N-acetylmuramyl pentapeptide phosphotransferase/UDP-N-acetylglucosamine-1-phosphate transferase